LDNPNPVAIAFEAITADKKIRKFWLPRVTFGVAATELEKKGDTISFKTPTVNGKIMRRNKPAADGTCPWKCEVTEGGAGVNAQVVADWFKSVYDSDEAAPPTEPGVTDGQGGTA
jgi:hypothetical protein